MAGKAKQLMDAGEKSFSDEAVIAACFALIAEKGLGKTRLSAIALRLAVPLGEVYQRFASVDAITAAFLDRVDAQMMENIGAESDKRDMYFDMLMSRFDTLQEHREGVKRWLQDLPKFPGALAFVLRRWEKSLSLMLDVAMDSPRFPIKKIGLAAVYFSSLREWMKDDSADMGKTMSSVDHNLGRAEEFASKYLGGKHAKG
ncbi:MAG: transcriptional regulator, TetR family protein [Alphaproteobacteria bacterium]|nr:transcriptional regulator, TetR family protein [Alphaproteobacteria bacterium]